MVTLSSLREFSVFARFLNITKASEALFISPSSLSKHLKMLEKDLGFELTYKQGGQILLTEEGGHFLSGIQTMLFDYDELVNECLLIKNDSFQKLVFQDPPFSDAASEALYGIVNGVRRDVKNARIEFVHERYRDRIGLLLADEIQLLLDYHCDPSHSIVEDYADQGIAAVPISKEPLVAWGGKAYFEGCDVLDTDRLRSLSVMISSDASSPMSVLLSELPKVLGFGPKVFISPARSARQYYYSNHTQGIYLLPESHSTEKLFSSRDDMRIIPFADSTLACYGYALLSMSSASFDLLWPYVDARRITIEEPESIPE